MNLLFLHAFFATTLFGAILADALFLRSKNSQILQPEALVASWRRWIGLYEMLAVVVVAGLGIVQWMPNMAAYSAPVFHSKFSLLLILLGLAKVRMLKERKSGVPSFTLTRLMLAVVTLMVLLGFGSSSGVIPR